MLALENLYVAVAGRTILSDVSFDVAPKEIVTIVGPNGSGKSTLLKAILGAVPVARGKVSKPRGLKIGYVPQKLAVDKTLPITVRRFLNLPRPQARAEISAQLEKAGIAHLAEKQLSSLSGGEFQRVLLTRAVLNAPNLLMLDEATQGLDQPATAAFYKLIETLRDDLGCGILMVSHDLHVVMSASDKVICLNGHVCCSGPPKIVSAAPEYRALFGHGTGGTLALYQHEHDHDHDHHHTH